MSNIIQVRAPVAGTVAANLPDDHKAYLKQKVLERYTVDQMAESLVLLGLESLDLQKTAQHVISTLIYLDLFMSKLTRGIR